MLLVRRSTGIQKSPCHNSVHQISQLRNQDRGLVQLEGIGTGKGQCAFTEKTHSGGSQKVGIRVTGGGMWP